MTTRLRIEWAPGEKVTALLDGPRDGPRGVLLAHGAGLGQRHPFMVGMRRRLAAAGLTTLTFDYPYMEAGRRAPDRAPKLLDCHRAALERLRERVDDVALVGKSMGGRVGGHLAAETDVSGLVFLGYPLVPMGKSIPRDTAHLDRVTCPMLFIQGERDRLAPLPAIRRVVSRLGASLEVVPEADHSYRVPKRAGVSPEEMLDRLAASTARFLKR